MRTIEISNIATYGWEAAIRGMRNPMNSWGKSDSCTRGGYYCSEVCSNVNCFGEEGLYLGRNDFSLMLRLAQSGTDHAKYRRMINVTMDILAPLYWWKEFDTYKVGTVANACSTMHKITDKEFTLDDFSHDKLIECNDSRCLIELYHNDTYYDPTDILDALVDMLNKCRDLYLETKDKKYWWQLIQLLPSSYNQLRTVQLNYEVLANTYKSRKDHKLDEWREFCRTIKTLPYSEIITLEEENNNEI